MREREIGSKFDFRVSNHDEYVMRMAGEIAGRAVIHLLALQGYQGPEGIENVDPFALISVQ